MIITAGGENVAPVPIEETIKEMLPCISNAILIGEKRKYLSCFLTFKVTVDKDNNDMPTDQLIPAAIDWCKSVGSSATKVSEILTNSSTSEPDSNVMTAIQEGIDKANKRAVSRAANVRKWKILPLDISLPTGELGPTLKLKRAVFNEKYADDMDRLYHDDIDINPQPSPALI